MRALVVLVVMCLVSAVRPMPSVARIHASHTELDPAKSRTDVVPARRCTAPPRTTRSALDAVVVAPPAMPLPERYAVVELHALAGTTWHPVAVERSARGPPVG